MTKQQALNILIELARMAPVNYQTHAQGDQAAQILTKAIAAKNVHEESQKEGKGVKNG